MPLGRWGKKRLGLIVLMGSAILATACSSASSGDTGLEQLTTPGPNSQLDNLGSADGGASPGKDVGVPDGPVTPDTVSPQDATAPEDTSTETDSGPDAAPEGDATEADTAVIDPDAAPSDTGTGDDATEPSDAEAQTDGEDSGPEPLCTPGTTTCDGQSIVVCDPSGEAWNVIATCSDDMPCIDASCCKPECDGKACGDNGCGGSCGECGPGTVCAQGLCLVPPTCVQGEPCDDGDPCTSNDTCNDEVCSGTAVNCSDGDPCTKDSCGAQGCVNAPIDCDDANPCTQDGCGPEGCTHEAIDCDDGQACTEDSCGPEGCVNEAIDCDDGDPCTEDSCDAEGCVFKPKSCDDGLFCTSDSCSGGQCQHAVIGDSCLIDGACIAAGASSEASVCLTCNPAESTSAWSPAFDAPCDDGDACTEGDTCQPGTATEVACQGTSIVEDNGDPCLDVVCVAGDVWEKNVNDVSCTPDDPCSAAGTCLDGTCVPQTPCECYDNDDCAIDEVCDDFSCTESFCGNGICDPGDDEDCSEDCTECPNAAWCLDLCVDPITANPACSQSCCGDGFCALNESANCCPEDCAAKAACDQATVVDTVPTTIQGNHSDSNAVLSTNTDECDSSGWVFGVNFGAGREDVIAFTAPFKGTFLFQLEGPWNSQLWLFDDCEDPYGSCVTTGPELTGQGSISEVELEAGQTIFVAVDSLSIYFGAGAYTLIIDGLCTPDCSNKQCGDDGCGGSCGSCGDAKTCAASGACINNSEVCNYHLDCAHNEVCGWWPTDELNRCSALCKGPKNCFSGQICERAPGAAHVAYCRAKTDKADIGEPCTDSGSCDSGICLQGACREACISQKGCNGQDVCRKVAVGTSVTAACVPEDGGLTGTACSACTSQHCDVFSEDPSALCADICVTTSDCEDGQACYLVDHSEDINMDTVPYHPTYPDSLNDAIMGCFTHPDGLGNKGDGESCSASSQCESGICLPISAEGGYYCTRPCYKNADCGGGMSCRLTGINLVSTYLPEVGLGDPGAWSLVRICDFP